MLSDARRSLANLEAVLMRPDQVRFQIAALDADGFVIAEDVYHFIMGDRLVDDPPENVRRLEPIVARKRSPEK